MGFVGENGAGKITTIGCILGTLFKDGGIIKIFGKEMSNEDIKLREDIGVVFDGENFPGYLTAKQLAAIMRGIYANWDDSLFKKYLDDFALKTNTGFPTRLTPFARQSRPRRRKDSVA